MKKGYSFLLLEVLIALTLLSICTVAFLKPSHERIKEKAHSLKLLKLEKRSKECFFKLKCMIWEKRLFLPLTEKERVTKGYLAQEGCHYKIKRDDTKSNSNTNGKAYLFTVTLTFDKEAFSYPLYVEEVKI